MVIRMPHGGGIRALEHHSENLETLLGHLPGLKVVTPSTPYDAKGLLLSALRDPDPVIFLEPSKIYRAFKQEVPEEDYTIPIGKAKILRQGKDITVVTWGAYVHDADKAAKALEAEGISVELIDLRTIAPIDRDTVIESVKSGFTCLFDHHASPFSVDGSLDFIEKAFKQIGVRGSLCYEVSNRDGEEIARQGIKENVRFIKKNKEDDMVKGIFGLHASFTLSNETLKLCSEEGNALGSGFHIHAAEGMEDYEQCRRSYEKGVEERLSDYSIVGNKSILAHCIHVKEKELDLLKKVNVVHNPESNMNNAVGYCDAAKMMEKGIDPINYPLFIEKALQFSDTIVPKIIDKLKEIDNISFAELSVKIIRRVNI
jgi:hypothetical protein